MCTTAAAFPRSRFIVDDQIAEGDEVCVRYRSKDAHRPVARNTVTGKRATYSGILISRIAGDRIAEQWTEFDLLGFLKQLGAPR